MMKTLLLAGATGLATISLARAADVPMEAAEAVEYVKVCTEFGEGFFYIPGTDTCLRLSGHVRADYRFQDHDSDTYSTNTTTFGGNARLNIDARTATEYGTLRSFVELNTAVVSSTSSGARLGKAYIQLGGLTAGFAASAFNFYDTNYANTIFAGYFAPYNTVNLISYTATFGGGFYATLSIEDGMARRGDTDAFFGDIDGDGIFPTAGAPVMVSAEVEGHDIPDIVAAIGASQSWGNAQVMAAIHNIDARATFGTIAPADVRVEGDEWGYAVGAGVGINLPIAAGGHFAIEAVYADGALDYLGDAGGLVADHVITYDGFNTAAVGDDLFAVDTTSGWSVTGEVQVRFSPALVGSAFGSYVSIDAAGAYAPASGSSITDIESYILGANLVYTITRGLTVGAEVSYRNTETDSISRSFVAAAPVNALVTTSVEDEQLNFGVRLERRW
ncbi:MAG: porin [Labrys sp. (in: a-proteobacteria)]